MQVFSPAVLKPTSTRGPFVHHSFAFCTEFLYVGLPYVLTTIQLSPHQSSREKNLDNFFVGITMQPREKALENGVFATPLSPIIHKNNTYKLN